MMKLFNSLIIVFQIKLSRLDSHAQDGLIAPSVGAV